VLLDSTLSKNVRWIGCLNYWQRHSADPQLEIKLILDVVQRSTDGAINCLGMSNRIEISRC